ncbi:hypothetical protein, partial [Mesorhizobium sp.]|uniref:hypothetical protein n=1 Tax=Mesorhizobium sp. TaxID=1871066 RepID=UPI0025C07DE6
GEGAAEAGGEADGWVLNCIGAALDLLRKLLILAVAGAVAAGAVALVEQLMFEAPRPAVADKPLPPPAVKKQPVRQWNRHLT